MRGELGAAHSGWLSPTCVFFVKTHGAPCCLSMHLCITLCFNEKKVLAAKNTRKQQKAVACGLKDIKAVAIHFSSDNEEFCSLF